jgi:tetratricopeptide (TPR) repeat protein
LKPDYAEAHYNLGNTLQELGRLDEALASYTQAIALKPDFADAHLNLCELLEKMNRIDEISFVIRNASEKTLKKKADFLYFEVLIEFRKENYETAAELLEKLNIIELADERQMSAMKLQGDIHHHKKNYSAAFEAYKSKNKLVKDSLEYKKQEPEKYYIQQREKVAQIEQLQEQTAYKSAIKPSWIQPTFLIGFPRSGTTLLDTILRTHSNIDVLEELPMLNKMNASFGEIPTISKIEAMDNTAAEIASGFYFEELRKHIKVGKKQIIVDKLPLNILQLPLINQVFPNARYIIALRHPLDCVLSCWMQEFKLNPAMANMIELERIVDFYDAAMSILKLSQERYSLNIHRIRYEDLVLDFEENVTNLLTFLGLEWEAELRNYQKTALARGKINTPSYSQVIKPLYKTASYRWKNYEEFLEPYKSRLAPWIKEYGYSS